MDVPPLTPALTGGGRDVLSADAYEQFWDCLENDGSVGEELSTSEDAAADAYGQFWQQADA
jgi:hypothetical protein